MGASDVQDGALGADRLGGEQEAVEHQVRARDHESAVLGTHRLGLGSVGDHHRVAARALASGRPLARRRVRAPTPATKAGDLDDVDEPAARKPRQRTEPSAVRGE